MKEQNLNMADAISTAKIRCPKGCPICSALPALWLW